MRERERRIEKEKRGKKGKERERVEGEPRRIEKKGVTGEDMCAREEETEATEIYRIQSRDVPESAGGKGRKDRIVKTPVFAFITDREFR